MTLFWLDELPFCFFSFISKLELHDEHTASNGSNVYLNEHTSNIGNDGGSNALQSAFLNESYVNFGEKIIFIDESVNDGSSENETSWSNVCVEHNYSTIDFMPSASYSNLGAQTVCIDGATIENIADGNANDISNSELQSSLSYVNEHNPSLGAELVAQNVIDGSITNRNSFVHVSDESSVGMGERNYGSNSGYSDLQGYMDDEHFLPNDIVNSGARNLIVDENLKDGFSANKKPPNGYSFNLDVDNFLIDGAACSNVSKIFE